jgi:hypothetical protein
MNPKSRRTARPGAGPVLLGIILFVASAPPPASTEERPDARPPRFRVELYGGVGQPGLSDLNRFAAADEAVQEFGYDRLLDYQRQSGLISGWNKTLTGKRGTIGLAAPLGLRVRWRLSAPLSLSLGVRLSSARRASEYSFAYARTDSYGYEDRETVAYDPYRLSSRFLAVLAGAHFAKPLFKRWSLEAFLAAGPVFADCEYASAWVYTWHRRGPDQDWDVFEMAGSLEEKGRGTGLAADLGVRLERPLGRRLALFVEAAYGLQAVRTVKGSGREVRGGVVTEWEGTWAFKKETIAAPWGALETETPSSFWPEGSAAARSRDFKLDASGFQARIGFSFLF